MNEYNLVKEKQEKNKAFPIIMFTLTIIVAIEVIAKIVLKDQFYDVLALYACVQCVKNICEYKYFKHKEDFFASVCAGVIFIALIILYLSTFFD